MSADGITCRRTPQGADHLAGQTVEEIDGARIHSAEIVKRRGNDSVARCQNLHRISELIPVGRIGIDEFSQLEIEKQGSGSVAVGISVERLIATVGDNRLTDRDPILGIERKRSAGGGDRSVDGDTVRVNREQLA